MEHHIYQLQKRCGNHLVAREIKRAFMRGGLQWIHEGRGSSCLLWEHGGGGGPAAYSRYFGTCAGGTWRQGGLAAYSEWVHEGRRMWGRGSSCLQWIHVGRG